MKTLSNEWHKPTRSPIDVDDCVEAMVMPNGEVAIRSSRRPNDGLVLFAPSEWDTFIKAVVEDGEFRLPTS